MASDVGGIPEIVLDNETGLLFDNGSASDLAAMTMSLLSSMQRRELYARAGVERVQSEFTLSLQADRYLELYAELIEREESTG